MTRLEKGSVAQYGTLWTGEMSRHGTVIDSSRFSLQREKGLLQSQLTVVVMRLNFP
jgi:hypothetical protein